MGVDTEVLLGGIFCGRARSEKKVLHKKSSGRYYGVVEDEVVVLEKPNEDYRDLIQLIRWDDGLKSIRFCYYVMNRKGKSERWVFSNHPISIQPRYLKQLIKKASRKEWFVKILR